MWHGETEHDGQEIPCEVAFLLSPEAHLQPCSSSSSEKVPEMAKMTYLCLCDTFREGELPFNFDYSVAKNLVLSDIEEVTQ